ncbi:MAG: FAD-binding oxidoreductase [Spirochaetaceae bacterium]|nr:FAD-binding oxidoreductase [Spirochaetaceae bacterium]MDT8297151.1 FAD-binding oxidoreductase [Spirochaetaceae bacterium]
MIQDTRKHKILGLRELGEGAFVVRIERRNMEFAPGQYIHVGPIPGIDRREYSVYSSSDDDFLEILVKEVDQGSVSPKLRQLKVGDEVDVEGPFGFFRIEEGDFGAPMLFIATGTGISPFHCLIKSYPDLDYRLIHGVRHKTELYDHDAYEPDRVVSCLSRDDGGDFSGRVTSWLKGNPAPEGCLAYLCGNCDMIYEAYDILGSQGVGADRIHAEVYF